MSNNETPIPHVDRKNAAKLNPFIEPTTADTLNSISKCLVGIAQGIGRAAGFAKTRRRAPHRLLDNDRSHLRSLCLAAIVGLSMAPGYLSAAELHGNAFVQKDTSLKMGGRIIRLLGIYIPTSGCHTLRGANLESWGWRELATRALDEKTRGFVRCVLRWRNRDGSSTAVCYRREEDISAYLIGHGFALATPNAPVEYHALERIARAKRRGVWGFCGEGYY